MKKEIMFKSIVPSLLGKLIKCPLNHFKNKFPTFLRYPTFSHYIVYEEIIMIKRNEIMYKSINY